MSVSKRGKKQLNIVGGGIRDQIYEFIVEHSFWDHGRKGVKPAEISKHVRFKGKPISRETRAQHLNGLMDEKKVYKRDGRCFASDLELGIMHNFGKCMNEACGIILNNILNPILKNKVFRTTLIGRPDPSFIEFSKAISGNAVSKKFCRATFDRNSLNEKYFFEFANRLGAYVIYIFISSIQISIKEHSFYIEQRKKHDYDKRIGTLRSALFNKSFNLDSVFDDFINQFRPLDNSSFDTLMEAFGRVYPGILKGLQKKWRNEVADHSNWLEASEQNRVHCDHSWEPLSIIMLPEKYYFCRKCSHLIDEKHMKRISEQMPT
jgi:hypothetical protein